MVLVFDLDDTLYDEVDFVYSGFKEVSMYISTDYELNFNDIFEVMVNEFNLNGRGKVFDIALKSQGIYSKNLVRKCLSVYRLHRPNILLSNQTIRCLKLFSKLSLYLVTDGNKIVQNNKVEALDIHKYFKKIFITHRYGIKNAKPSVYCFNKICEFEGVESSSVFYIGDNPNKDFINLKKSGFQTIRILRGHFANQVFTEQYDADYTIKSLDDLTVDFLKSIYISKNK